MNNIKTQVGQDKNEQMSIFSERIELVRENLGLNRAEFAEQLGIPYRSYMNYRVGRTPPAEVLAELVRVFKVNAFWLLIGQGEMFMNPSATSTVTRNAVDGVEKVIEGAASQGKETDAPAGEFSANDVRGRELAALMTRRADGVMDPDLPLKLLGHLIDLHEENRKLRQRYEDDEEPRRETWRRYKTHKDRKG